LRIESRMRSVLLFASVAMAAAAIQHPSPIYTRSPTVVSSSVVGPAGKSLTTNTNNIQQQNVQPVAEERESGFGTQEATNPGQVGNPVGSVPASPQQTPNNPQTFRIVYYPNSGSLTNPQPPYNPGTAYAPPESQINFWTKYHMTEVVVGILSLGLVVGGGALLYPRFVDVRARALRELADINSEDAARLTKNVFKALERLYDMNNAE